MTAGGPLKREKTGQDRSAGFDLNTEAEDKKLQKEAVSMVPIV